jgi:RNA polymerase sigma factor (sigma-70 family)
LAIAAAPPAVTVRPASEHTDHELVAAVRAGDDRAFEQLYARYHRRIASYVQGMVHDHGRAEDIAQDVFISALRRMRETERPIAFKPWIYEIAKNACIDQFRRSRRAEEVSFDAETGLAAADQHRLTAKGPSPDVAVEHKQQLDHLCGAFGGLSEAHHEILVLREFEGLSYREIGERLGMSRPSVESTLFRARRRLSEEYDELVTGERCQRVQAIVRDAATGTLGARDRRRLGRHISHCQACRKHAGLAGLDTADLAERKVRARLAALLPLPAFLRRRDGADDGGLAASISANAHPIAHWSTTVAHYVEPGIAGWTKAAAAAATLAAGGATTTAHVHELPAGPAPAAQHAAAQPGALAAAAARSALRSATAPVVVLPAASAPAGTQRAAARRGTSTTAPRTPAVAAPAAPAPEPAEAVRQLIDPAPLASAGPVSGGEQREVDVTGIVPEPLGVPEPRTGSLPVPSAVPGTVDGVTERVDRAASDVLGG